MANTGNINGTWTADIVKVDGIAVASIAAINGITWVENSGSIYNNYIGSSCMFDATDLTALGVSADADPGQCTVAGATWSVWIKRTALGSSMIYSTAGDNTANNNIGWGFNASDQFYLNHDNSASLQGRYHSNDVFRDCSGWYHFFLTVDVTAAAGNRVHLWVNGNAVTLVEDDAMGTVLNARRNTAKTKIGYWYSDGPSYFSGYLAQFVMLFEQVGTVTDFGEFVGPTWIPKDVSAAVGGNADDIYLDFYDSADLGDDASGNGIDFALTNMDSTHYSLDNPENNYCTLDYNTRFNQASSIITDGGLSYHYSGGAAWVTTLGTFLMKSGKWYWEINVGSDDQYEGTGIVAAGENSRLILGASQYVGEAATSWGMLWDYGATQRLYNGGAYDATTAIGAITVSTDVIQVAFDADNNKLWFGQNNTWDTGDPAAGTSPSFDSTDGIDSDLYDLVPAFSTYAQTANPVAGLVNFGQRAFAYTPPSGFKALCVENLDAPILDDPSDAIDVVLYTGTGAELAISSLSFQPDLVWIKNRDQADPHHLFDSLQGATYWLESDDTTVQQSGAQTLKTFDTNGFTLGTDAEVNTNTEDFVAWCLLRGSGYGFTLITYEGTGAAHTESHLLGQVPKMIMIKDADDAYNWTVYHYAAINKTDPETDFGVTNDVAVWADLNTAWNDTAPTASNITVGTSGNVNESGKTYFGYLFGDVEGQTKCFHYEGNGADPGPYVYLGFRPRWIIIKDADGANNWITYDTDRNPTNPADDYLVVDTAVAEAVDSTLDIDITANGFKLRSTHAAINTSEHTYIGVAFAEQPYRYANAR